MKRSYRRLLAVTLIGSFTAGAALTAQRSFADESETGPSIKKIMKIGFSGDKKANIDPLCKVVASGKATHDTADELLKLCKDLAAAKPPRGDEADWKKRTDALVAAAEELDMGDKPSRKAIADFKSADDCKGCHMAHRPPKK